VEAVMGDDLERVESWIREWIAQLLHLDVAHVEPGQPIAGYGVDSIEATTLAGDLERLLGLSVRVGAVCAALSAREIAERLMADRENRVAHGPQRAGRTRRSAHSA
jgi:acyl carrier protein